MRISAQEVEAIITVLTEYVHYEADLRLFGSRVDDDKRGGDIDLLLLLSNQANKSKLISMKHEILSKIKSKIGEQKIDLLIRNLQEAENDAFIQLVLPESISLKQWG